MLVIGGVECPAPGDDVIFSVSDCHQGFKCCHAERKSLKTRSMPSFGVMLVRVCIIRFEITRTLYIAAEFGADAAI